MADYGTDKRRPAEPESWWSSDPPQTNDFTNSREGPDFSAPPQQFKQQPPKEGQQQQRQPRMNFQNLLPPTHTPILLLIIALLGLFLAFTSWQQQNTDHPVVYATSSATVHQVVIPAPEETSLVVQTVVQTVTVSTTKTRILTEKVLVSKPAPPSSGVIAKDLKKEKNLETQEISTMSSTERT
jgi:hypothetical protein